jgi:uncharacterized membrane protein
VNRGQDEKTRKSSPAAPNMRGIKSGSLLDQSFRFGITLKGLYALLETILGIAILKVNPQALDRYLSTLLHPELSEDPGDFVATHLLRASQQFAAGGKHFASMYLVSHGLVKIVLVVALLRNKLWAYPTMIFTLSAFVFYQAYRFVLTRSLVMIFLTLFDIVVIVLTWLEYGKQRSLIAGT